MPTQLKSYKSKSPEGFRTEIRALVIEISHVADIELLDLMADKIGSFARHKAAQDARTRASTARITLETGLMQLARALPGRANEETKNRGAYA
jgi:hypothetical protein